MALAVFQSHAMTQGTGTDQNVRGRDSYRRRDTAHGRVLCHLPNSRWSIKAPHMGLHVIQFILLSGSY